MPDRRGNAVAIRPLDEDDPLPPDDRLTGEELRAELESLYRDSAAPIAKQLARAGARDALDLVHEGFARMLALAIPKRAAIGKPRAYIATISRNLHADHGRESVRYNAWLDGAVEHDGEHHDAVVHLESRDTLRRLEAALKTLRPVTREVFVARRVDGLSYAEISELTGLSPNAIEKHMAKAIAKLSRLMDRG